MGAEVDVVISGGSIEGICDAIGFLKAITVDLGHKVVCAAGSSAGSIILGAYASGKPLDEIEELVVSTDISRLVSLPRWWQVITIYRALRRGWVSDAQLIEKLFSQMTYDKKFKDLTIDLHLAGSDLDRKELYDFNIMSDPDMTVAQAMRISCCIPGLFKPAEYNGSTFFDGSIRSYFPVELIPDSQRPLFGFVTNTVDDKLKTGLYGTLVGLINHSVDANIRKSLRMSRRRPSIVTHNGMHVGSTEFNLPTSTKQKLIKLAHEATLTKLASVNMA